MDFLSLAVTPPSDDHQPFGGRASERHTDSRGNPNGHTCSNPSGPHINESQKAIRSRIHDQARILKTSHGGNNSVDPSALGFGRGAAGDTSADGVGGATAADAYVGAPGSMGCQLVLDHGERLALALLQQSQAPAAAGAMMYGSGLGMAGGMSPGRSSLMPPGMGITRPSLQQIQMQQMLMMQQHVYGEGLEFGRHMPLAAQSGGPGGTMMMVQAPNGQPQCVMIPNLGSGLGGGPLGASLGSMTPHGSMYPPVMSMVPGQYNLGQASAPGQCRWGQQQQRQQLTVPAGSGSNSQLRMMQRIDAAALPIATSTAATVSADVKLEYESPLTSTSMDRHSTITTTETASPIGNPKLAVQHQHAAAAGGFPFIASGEPYSGPNSKGVMTAGADRGGHDSTTANTIMPQIPALKRKQPVSWKVAQDSAAKPRKTKRFRPMPAEEWHKAIQNACKLAFNRIQLRCHADVRDTILRRITAGQPADVEGKSGAACPCFFVQRQGEASKSPFQIKVAGARLLAQKSIYVAYHGILAADTGTWQVQQSCLHSDKSWWCFEPSHLIKCDRDHVPAHIQKHPIPSSPQAVYIARSRSAKAQAKVLGDDHMDKVRRQSLCLPPAVNPARTQAQGDNPMNNAATVGGPGADMIK